MTHLYDSSYSDIEALIERCAPALMKSAAALPEDSVVRPEKRPKSTHAKRTGYLVISPEAAAMISRMHELSTPTIDIAASLGLSEPTVRDHIRKQVVKKRRSEADALRAAVASDVVAPSR